MHPGDQEGPCSALSPAAPASAGGPVWELWRQHHCPDFDDFAAGGALSREQVLALLRCDQHERWHTGERIPAETYLRRYRLLREDAEAAFLVIYSEFMLRQELAETPTLEEYLWRFPEHAEDLRQQDAFNTALGDIPPGAPPTLRAAPSVLEAGIHELPMPTAGAPGWPAIKGYEILAELGRGGMGIVYKARQLGLNRLVALKVLRAGDDADPDLLTRFRREAEAVARLQHPHLVQIHEVGEQDGRPYCVLELVDGGSLAQKLAGTPQPARLAAPLVETLAWAMHAAHERNVVHRDLKPANILLAVSGQRSAVSPTEDDHSNGLTADRCLLTAVPKITDFGLAKRLDVPLERTRSGVILGTPSYMAPEQAAGHSKEVGPAVDVYALGAILYEMLAGRPPFQGESLLETLQQVVSQEPVSPRSLQPKVPRDLETICLKCLQKEPRQRYLTAHELADDLRRFQAGEPIRARPAGAVERLGRWCRRRPLVAALSAGLLILFLGGFGGVTHQWLATDRERRRAEAGFRKAKQAVDECFTRATEDPALQGPAMMSVRRLLLQTTLPYYRDFLAEHAADPNLKEEMAGTHAKVGTITAEVGLKEDARGSFEESRRLWQELVDAGATAPRVRSGLASTLNSLGRAQMMTGRRDEALQSLERARAIGEQLTAEFEGPAARECRRDLAVVCRNLGAIHHEAGRRDAAAQFYERARAILEDLNAEDAGDASLALNMVMVLNNLGLLHWQGGDLGEALRLNQRARHIADRWVVQVPANTELLHHRSITYHRLGLLHQEAHHPQEAFEAYEEARKILTRLLAAYPLVVEFQRNEGEILDHLGDWHREAGRPADALRCYEQGRDVWEKLVANDFRDTRLRCDLAICLNAIGQEHQEAERPDPSFRAYLRARELLRPLSKEDPADTLVQHHLATNLFQVSLLDQEPARRDEALGLCEEARAIWERLAQQDRANVRYRRSLAACLSRVAKLHLQASGSEKAFRFHEAARDAWEEILANDPYDHEARSGLAVTLDGFGFLLRKTGRLQQALASFQGAINHQSQAINKMPQGAKYRKLLTQHYAQLAQLQRELGRPAEAAAATLERRQLWPHEPEQLYSVASDLVQCIPLVGRGKTDLTSAEQAERRRYADQAMEVLRQAVADGYKDVEKLKKDTALVLLQSRREFQELVRKLEGKAKLMN